VRVAVRRDFMQTYPRCTGGAQACPAEDCGGVYGYTEIVAGMIDDIRVWRRPATTRSSSTRRRSASTTQPTGWRMPDMGRGKDDCEY
jgi:hypothetical protein